MTRSHPRRVCPPPLASGFTLIELMIVVVIIGIVIALILTAAMGGVRRAEERATQGLISKLETALDDRLQALLQTQPDYNDAHAYMAGIYASGIPEIQGLQRVNVIARYDQMKAEVPDVFLLSYIPTTGGTPPDYPFNFAAAPFAAGTPSSNLPSAASAYAPYFLPLGNGYLDSPSGGSFGAAPLVTTANPQWNPTGTGIFGASYTAAAGLYKNLGYASAGYDGADNNQNGLIDEYSEGIMGLTTQPNGGQVAQISTRLFNHTHKTARSEVLYALLVEGQGPLGSVMNRDDFTDKEVQDTDGDGLPEFVDAWGEPLQFYRWPIYHHSDLQRGVPVNNNYNAQAGAIPVGNGVMNYPYLGPFDPREQDPLDPSLQLMAPSWWSSNFNTGTSTTFSYSSVQTSNPSFLSPGATAFSTFFHPLFEPMVSAGAVSGPTQNFNLWDRGTIYFQRRAFFTKFLIASSGPDTQLGIARLDTLAGQGGVISMPTFTAGDLLLESQARQMNFFDSSNSLISGSPNANPAPLLYGGTTLYDASQDDITNHNYQAPGGIVQ